MGCFQIHAARGRHRCWPLPEPCEKGPVWSESLILQTKYGFVYRINRQEWRVKIEKMMWSSTP